jgi:fermentation-respiration switch protein FrsA (DUF1100 family)
LRVKTGKSKPIDPFEHYPLDPTTSKFVQEDLAPLNPMSDKIDLEFTDSIIGMNAEQTIASISPRPIFIGHGKRNFLHPKEEAEELYKAAGDPKTLYWVNGAHNDFMHYDDPEMNSLMERVTEFFQILTEKSAE